MSLTILTEQHKSRIVSNRRSDVHRCDDKVLTVGEMHFCFVLDMGDDVQKRGFRKARD